MRAGSIQPVAGRLLAVVAGAAAAAYGSYVIYTWARYGHPRAAPPGEEDGWLDRFMPVYDVVDRHHAQIAAPADVTLAAAQAMDLWSMPAVRAIFRARELMLGSTPDARRRPHGLLEEVRALGWGTLADVPGREVVMGAVTRPWEADVTFRAVPPDAFAAFDEPGYVKIAWTLAADDLGAGRSRFRTETRAVATDAGARRRFRRYWSCLSPGIVLIRWMMLKPLRLEAERRVGALPQGSAAPAALTDE